MKDFSCGFRAYRVDLLGRALERWTPLLDTTGFDCMPMLLLKLGAIGAKCAEVPMILRYDQKRGDSKMQVERLVKAYFRLAWRTRVVGWG